MVGSKSRSVHGIDAPAEAILFSLLLIIVRLIIVRRKIKSKIVAVLYILQEVFISLLNHFKYKSVTIA